MIRLDAATEVADRPFAALASTREDLAVMERMLARLRQHIEALPELSAEQPAQRRRDDHYADPDAQGIHRIVITDTDRVREPGDLVLVGFFGQARLEVDHRPIVELESALIADMTGESSPLVYYNVHWPGVGWGNLVVFTDPATEHAWGHDPRHHEAVARSPSHYHSIRLQIGDLPGGIFGGGAIHLRRTRYLDFTGPEPWRAARDIVEEGPRRDERPQP
jgi:hypothetical protein